MRADSFLVLIEAASGRPNNHLLRAQEVRTGMVRSATGRCALYMENLLELVGRSVNDGLRGLQIPKAVTSAMETKRRSSVFLLFVPIKGHPFYAGFER